MKNDTPYTSGDWLVNSGQEDAFIAAWTEFARWSSENVAGAGAPYLIQDTDNSRHFISFGPWESFDAINAWRQLPGFNERIGKLVALCEQFEGKNYILRVALQ